LIPPGVLGSGRAGTPTGERSAPRVHEPPSVEACAEVLAGGQRLGFVGGGTALELGNPSTGVDALLCTRGLKRIVEYAPEDQVIVAEAGVTLGELQTLAAQNGQWLGVDAPHADRATLGGLVAVGAFGPRRARYGGIRELLLGVSLLRADGALAKSGGKVVKNVAGFDLPKVLCGSLGTLGLIAQVSLRLHPLPEASASMRLSDASASQVIECVRSLRQAQLEPASVVALQSGAGAYELGIRFEGFERGVERDTLLAAELGKSLGARTERLSLAEAAAFWERQDTVRTQPELRVRVSALPMHLREVEAFLAPLIATLHGYSFAWYATLGIGFLSGRPSTTAALVDALTLARAGAVKGGGALVVEAASAELRGCFDAWGPLPSAFAIMQGLKQRFDPKRRLNPGRFIGGI
jgi:glycolate dehydrogenase FAD-binding subunit